MPGDAAAVRVSDKRHRCKWNHRRGRAVALRRFASDRRCGIEPRRRRQRIDERVPHRARDGAAARRNRRCRQDRAPAGGLHRRKARQMALRDLAGPSLPPVGFDHPGRVTLANRPSQSSKPRLRAHPRRRRRIALAHRDGADHGAEHRRAGGWFSLVASGRRARRGLRPMTRIAPARRSDRFPAASAASARRARSSPRKGAPRR